MQLKYNLLKNPKFVSSKCDYYLIRIEFNMSKAGELLTHLAYIAMLCDRKHYKN